MPRSAVPTYGLHKASGKARVVLNGRHIYLGKYGSAESLEKYARLLAELAQAPVSPTPEPDGRAEIPTVNEIILQYWEHARSYYRKNGKPTSELSCIRYALRRLRKIYGSVPASQFGPKSLRAVQKAMIDQKLSRGVINKDVGRIKRMFKWAVAEELISPTILHGLQAVSGLSFGRTAARETEPIRPVPDEHVNALLPFVSPQVAAMIQLQRLTGMRPCEVTLLRSCDIDRSSSIWLYEPHEHKNTWRGHRRVVPLGPRAQKVLGPFLTAVDPSAYVFSPVQAEAQRNTIRRQQRKSPMTPSQARRKPKAHPKRPKHDRYDTNAYRHAILYGLRKAARNGINIPKWFPLQLRHSRATEVRKQHGLEGAQLALGHVHADVTEVYAEKNLALAIQIALESG